MQQLHKLTGLRSRLNLGQTQYRIILLKQMDAADNIKQNFNQLRANMRQNIK